jgi:transcriptional regulator with XRE-family HTH domain
MDSNELSQPHSEGSRTGGEGGFAARLKGIRLRLQNKQGWLSGAIGCSDAAVSFWESGARVPSPRSLGRLLDALAQEGTPTSELLELRRIWCDECIRREARRGPNRT